MSGNFAPAQGYDVCENSQWKVFQFLQQFRKFTRNISTW